MAIALGKDLKAVTASAAGRQGVVWTLEGGGDLNANLVRFGSGRGVGEHVNDEVDVVFVGVSGSGTVVVDGEKFALEPGQLVFVPKGCLTAVFAKVDPLSRKRLSRRIAEAPSPLCTRGDQYWRTPL